MSAFPSHHGPAMSLQPPGWAAALGAVAVVLGLFLSAYHATEWMKQKVLLDAAPAGDMPAAVCPPEELEEEGLSRAECEYMVDHVRGIILSMPPWFPSTQMWLSGVGALLAFLSVIAGGMLVNFKPSAPVLAGGIFTGLAAVDALQFTAVVNAGPIIRDIYLWSVLLWFMIHLLFLAGLLAARQGGDRV